MTLGVAVIEIATLSSPRAAQAFVDYLATQSIACQLRPEGQGVMLLLHDPGQESHVRSELQKFAENPSHPRYMAASWERSDNAGVRFDYGAPGTGLMRNFLLHAGPVNLIVLAICAVVFLFSFLGMLGYVRYWLQFFPSIDALTGWQQWRWLTPAFIHFSFMHLIMNALWWWYLGGQLEQKEGSRPLLILFLLTAALPNFAQFLLSGPNFGGLSGVVYGLFGYVWVRGMMAPTVGLSLTPGLTGFMLIWLVIGFLGWFGPPMANMAHFGGLLVGAGYAATRSINKKGLAE
ncbi:rhomboid family intramembrane serine protease GlpG [Corallincola luteus]|uniref:Rhomboid family intramembrane serine protease GlpG n=2 Tax=Corallincola TaxID=1775176 RepID=A0ABY1WQ05_9GAMM|nr:rhomboid family intramembrane serine protease GlpG [Corallincola spongiicola]TCI01397.1 rhomboid family intramembrane serine protease GlpG [Corallincola luteus]